MGKIGVEHRWLSKSAATSWPELQRKQHEREVRQWVHNVMVEDYSFADVPVHLKEEVALKLRSAEEAEKAQMGTSPETNDHSFGL